MNEPIVTVVGRVGGDPELNYTKTDQTAVVNFSVAQTPRVKRGDNWEDGETMWFRCTAWRALAENIASEVTKGDEVIITGRLKLRKWETEKGKGENLELDVENIGTVISPRPAKQKASSVAPEETWAAASYNDETPF